jgi:hypothetical protein
MSERNRANSSESGTRLLKVHTFPQLLDKAFPVREVRTHVFPPVEAGAHGDVD